MRKEQVIVSTCAILHHVLIIITDHQIAQSVHPHTNFSRIVTIYKIIDAYMEIIDEGDKKLC